MKRKVVIPETEVKHVCELSEKDYLVVMNLGDHSIINPARDENAAELTLAGNAFKKIEKQKPLADDEVSVKKASEDNIYAYKGFHAGSNSWKIYNVRKCNCSDTFCHCSYSGKGVFNWSFGDYSASKYLDCCIQTKLENKSEVFEFSGDNKQIEFHKWALEQLNEHA